MIVYTQGGRVYSENEYKSWLQEAGFVDIRKHDVCSESANASVALIAVRSSR
jgi:hypothetical protein